MNRWIKKSLLPLALLALLSGCSRPDEAAMQSGLMKSGMDTVQAECMAQSLKKNVKTDAYNYMANMMVAGLSEKEAANKTRRKFGGDFKSGLNTARSACSE